MRLILTLLAASAVGCGVDLPVTTPTPMPAHGSPSTIELNAIAGIGEHGGTARVQARVQDAYFATLPDVAVTFATSAGTFDAATVSTDRSGVAVVTLTANPGTVSVTAIAGAVSAALPIAIQPGNVFVPPTQPPPAEPPPPLIQAFTVAINAGVDTTAPAHTIVFGLSTQSTIVSAVWNFGDGSGTFTTTGSRAATTRHLYAGAGQPNVTVTATDSGGRVASDSVALIVP